MTKHNEVLEIIKDLTREHGRHYFNIKLISEQSGIPEDKLFENDNFTGILQDLSDNGKVVIDRSNRCVGLDSMELC